MTATGTHHSSSVANLVIPVYRSILTWGERAQTSSDNASRLRGKETRAGTLSEGERSPKGVENFQQTIRLVPRIYERRQLVGVTWVMMI